MFSSVGFAVLFLLFAPPQPEFGIEITVTGPATPFEMTRLEARVRRGTPIAGYSRRFQTPFGHQEAVGVVPHSALSELMADLESKGLYALKPVSRPAHRLRYRVVAVSKTGRLLDVSIDDPWLNDRPALVPVLAKLRSFIDEVAAPAEFVDPMLLDTESGRLRLVSQPPASVRLDGVLLKGKTPMRSVRVLGGQHVVEFTSLDGSRRERYEVRVEIGKTTTLNVTLSAHPSKDTP